MKPLVMIVLLSHLATAYGAEPKPEAPKEWTGKIMTLAKAYEPKGLKLDADAGMALVTEQGKIYPLAKDKTTRFLFMDTRLHGRTVQLMAKPIPDSNLLQVTEVYTVKDGQRHDVYYWCNNCALRASEPGACICCGAMTELVEVPVKKK